jgi:hypothetical protein
VKAARWVDVVVGIQEQNLGDKTLPHNHLHHRSCCISIVVSESVKSVNVDGVQRHFDGGQPTSQSVYQSALPLYSTFCGVDQIGV